VQRRRCVQNATLTQGRLHRGLQRLKGCRLERKWQYPYVALLGGIKTEEPSLRMTAVPPLMYGVR